jgi:hypothetical protein
MCVRIQWLVTVAVSKSFEDIALHCLLVCFVASKDGSANYRILLPREFSPPS